MDGAGMTADGSQGPQVEELLRVNAELAAELRALRAERTEAPRQRRVPAARGIARLREEREALETQLRETRAALEATQAGLESTLEATQGALEEAQGHRQGLERQNQEMAAEIVRLRTGPRGLMRRARAHLLDRTGLFDSR